MSNTNNTNTNTNEVVFIYKECLKNHAASLGTTATDGCGEFMPSGDPLHCSACGCHRNFHRKVVADGGGSSSPPDKPQCCPNWGIGKPLMTPRVKSGSHNLAVICPVGPTPSLGSDKLEMNGREGKEKYEVKKEEGQVREIKKRQRTKFTMDQKVKMLSFAEKVEWKIHKVDEGLVQQFCQEVGIKRRVLKVWMHNNKHHFVNKSTHSPDLNTLIHSNSSDN